MRTRLIWLTLVLVLGAGACGGDGDDGDGSAEDGALNTASTTTTVALSGDEAVVSKIVLQQSDFPAGWTAAPADQEDDEEAERALAECLGVEYQPDRPRAQSPEFSMGQLNQVGAVTELAPTADVAATEFAAIKGPKAGECVKSEFDRTVAEDSGGVTFTPARVEAREAPQLGDGSHALRLTTGVSAPDGSSVPIYADFVFIQKGRAEISLSFISGGQPFDAALASDLAQKLTSRA